MSQTEAESATHHTQTWRQEATNRVGVALIAICLSLALLNRWVWPALTSVLRYERERVLHGELWRLLSAHFVHGDLQHLVFNMLGTALVVALFPQTYSALQWLFVLASSALAIDLGFLVLEPSLHWYVGLSGVLHGLLAAGGVAWWRAGHRVLAALLGVVLLGKVGWEQWQGALPLVSGLEVIVDAHAYGAIGGWLAGVICGRRMPSERATHASL